MLNAIAAVLLAAGQAGSAPAAAAFARQTNVQYAWAHVLRVDPVYEMVPQPNPSCEMLAITSARRPVDHGASGGEPVSASTDETALPVEPAEPMVPGQPEAALPGQIAAPTVACKAPAEPELQQQLTGFDVEYRFRGDVYFARLPYDPGGRLRVRVEVSPAE